MAEGVPVSAISQERLARWLANCEQSLASAAMSSATPLVLVAISHDERAGEVQVYRTEDGPSDAAIGALLRAIGNRIYHRAGQSEDGQAGRA